MIPGKIKNYHLAVVCLCSALSHLLKLDKGFTSFYWETSQVSSHNTYEKLKKPNQTITKANPYKTGTTPIKWLLHPSANCTWTVTLYWPLHRPTVPMVVNTGLLVLWTTKLLCLWKNITSPHTKASHTFTLLSQFPDTATAAVTL